MRSVAKLFCFFFLLTASFFSCKKDAVEILRNNPPTIPTINKLPVANAGKDTVLKLPVDLLNTPLVLDGSGSHDTDGTITAYAWEKIAGPDLYCLDRFGSNASLRCMLPGNYSFRLKVTDNDGGISYDTVMVTGLGQPRPTVNVRLESLAEHFFAGATLKATTTEGKIFFVADNATRVDIYNISLHSWSNTQLSLAREGLAIVPIGNKVLFAGGGIRATTYTLVYFDVVYKYTPVSTVDIYDATRNAITTADLSVGRLNCAAAVLDKKVFIAGGNSPNLYGTAGLLSNRVDVYNSATNAWSIDTLSQNRTRISAATIMDKIMFAGGSGSNDLSSVIDIYDGINNKWTIDKLTDAGVVSSISSGSKVFWLSNRYHTNLSGLYNLEIYDLNTHQRSYDVTYWPSFGPTAQLVVSNNKMLVINTSISGLPLTLIDILDLSSNTWSVAQLNETLQGCAIISVANKIYVAGNGKLRTLDGY